MEAAGGTVDGCVRRAPDHVAHESLPLFMAPLTFRQSLVLGLLSHAARWAMFLNVATEQTTAIVVLDLPALWLLLRRPNVADARC